MSVEAELSLGAAMKSALSSVIGEQVAWAISVVHTEDGMEVVLSADEDGRELDILRIAQEFNLALKGLAYRALDEIAGGQANKEEAP